NSTWDRLAEYLNKLTEDREKFVINRSFDASREVVFNMWTNLDHLSKWFAPVLLKADIKSGGRLHYSMSKESGVGRYGLLNYLQIQPTDRIVYIQQYCDEEENISRNPVIPTWPKTMLATL